MIKYRVEIGIQAQADITDIVRYIGQVLLEPRTAGASTLAKTLASFAIAITPFHRYYTLLSIQ